MLEINMEFRKGILFVRLIGKLTEYTVSVLEKEVTRVVKEYGIANVVFNVSGLTELDQVGMQALIQNVHSQGKLVICGLEQKEMKKEMKKQHMFDYLMEVSDELSALHYLER